MTTLDPILRLCDMQMVLEAELARPRTTVGEILGLIPGSVLPLDQPLGSQVTLRVGGAPIGSGEIVAGQSPATVRIARIGRETRS